jgi:alpha-beta hydrolase superfamily lysophospholipase
MGQMTHAAHIRVRTGQAEQTLKNLPGIRHLTHAEADPVLLRDDRA